MTPWGQLTSGLRDIQATSRRVVQKSHDNHSPELQQLTQVIGNDRFHASGIEVFVRVYGDGAKAHHSPHPAGQLSRKDPVLLEEGKRAAHGVGEAISLRRADVHGKIDGCLHGPLKVDRDDIFDIHRK